MSPPTSLVAADYGEPTGRRSGSPLAGTIALSLALVGTIAVGGGLLMQKAFHNQAGMAMQLTAAENYKKGATLYTVGDYESAAATFHQVRLTPGAGDELIRKATDGELYCYRQLGQQAQKRGDLPAAEKWFQSAVAIAPNDAQAKTELEAVEKVRAASGAAPGMTPLAGSPSALPTPEGFPTPIGAAPAPPATTADFTSRNSRAASDAADLLAKGDDAAKRGDTNAAHTFWTQAVGAGPGSPAALTAAQRLQDYNDHHPVFGSE